MKAMSRAECLQFLQAGTRTGKLATVRPNGQPHCVPVWFVLDGDDLVFTTMSTTVKAKNLTAEPRVMICVDEETFPYDFVTVIGTAAIEQLTPDQLRPIATRIARRYVAAERAEEFGRRNAVAEEVLVRVRIERFLSAKGVAE